MSRGFVTRQPRHSPMTLWELVRYFLYLGAFGFGGPVALVGFMHRDLVERRKWISEEEYNLGLALFTKVSPILILIGGTVLGALVGPLLTN